MKVFIQTLGCKLNQYESSALYGIFEKSGFRHAESLEDADIAVINTCTVTNRADSKSLQAMRRAKQLGKKVVATGCYATTDPDRLGALDYVDLVVTNDAKFELPSLIKLWKSADAKKAGRASVEYAGVFPVVTEFEKTRAFLKIQDGCDKFCSYCKIPHARGRSRGLDRGTILAAVKKLAGAGFKEVVLTGVNISDYRHDGAVLYDIVEDILRIKADFRLRLSSLQPDEFDERLIGLLDGPKLARHFHLSLQSGSAGVLKRMERDYTPDFYLGLVEKIRTRAPDCGVTTDIIVGFPGETGEEFGETLELIRRARFTRVHIFPYSRRDHTRASMMKDTPDTAKKERVKFLESAALKAAGSFIKENVLGKPCTVLAEKKEKGMWNGYTSNYLRMHTKKELAENEWAELTPTGMVINKGVVELIGE